MAQARKERGHHPLRGGPKGAWTRALNDTFAASMADDFRQIDANSFAEAMVETMPFDEVRDRARGWGLGVRVRARLRLRLRLTLRLRLRLRALTSHSKSDPTWLNRRDSSTASERCGRPECASGRPWLTHSLRAAPSVLAL